MRWKDKFSLNHWIYKRREGCFFLLFSVVWYQKINHNWRDPFRIQNRTNVFQRRLNLRAIKSFHCNFRKSPAEVKAHDEVWGGGGDSLRNHAPILASFDGGKLKSVQWSERWWRDLVELWLEIRDEHSDGSDGPPACFLLEQIHSTRSRRCQIWLIVGQRLGTKCVFIGWLRGFVWACCCSYQWVEAVYQLAASFVHIQTVWVWTLVASVSHSHSLQEVFNWTWNSLSVIQKQTSSSVRKFDKSEK